MNMITQIGFFFFREQISSLYRERVDVDNYELPADREEEDPMSVDSEAEEVDSVMLSTKAKRKTYGQEYADMKLRGEIPHLQAGISLKQTRFITKKNLLTQFPYYSCQKGDDVKKKKHHSRKKSLIEPREPPDKE